MLVDTEAARTHGKAVRHPCLAVLRAGLVGAVIWLPIAACTAPEPEIIPAMAPAAPAECAIEWPDDPSAPPVMRCADGARETIRPGSALATGDPALLDAVP